MSAPPPQPERSFFDLWATDFRHSTHPLAPCLQSFVELEELRRRSREVDYLYSISTFTLIDEAKALSDVTTLGLGKTARPVVRLRDVAARLLLRLYEGGKLTHEVEQRLAQEVTSTPPTAALDRAAERLRGGQGKPLAEESGWLLAPDLVDCCALAAFVLEQASGGVPKVELADFLVALLAMPAGRKVVFEELLTDPSSTVTPDANRIIRFLLDSLDKQSGQLWLKLLDEIDMELSQAPTVEIPETPIPDYVADRPIQTLRDDILEFREDARAVAEIACQREPGPPLAIGLFGDWGSGKSSFMNLLRLEIDQLAGQSSAHAGKSPFVDRVAHVWFNAWQYNDAQLWPALAENTFTQLRAGGIDGLSRQLSEEVRKELSSKLDQWENVADELALDLMQTQQQETRKRDALLESADKRDKAIDQARSSAIQRLKEQLSKSGAQAAVADELIETTDTAATPGQSVLNLLSVLQAAWHFRKERWSVFLALVLLILTLSGAWRLVVPQLDLAPLFGSLASLATLLVWLQKAVVPIMRTLKEYRATKETQEREYRRTQRETELELARLQREIKRKENQVRRQLSRAAQFKGRSPGQVLDFFLSEGAAVRALQDEVGVVSRVRRAFAQLNALIATQDMTASGKTQKTMPERIVFYIDDLDRCHAEQVVRVLEAVHLLLAFDRFIVVVGVDTRWLETSLMSFYKEQLRADLEVLPKGNGVIGDPRATVRDYVEKIFQVPIQIPGLTSGDQGTFARLVEVLCPVVESGDTGETGEEDGKADLARYRKLAPIRPLDVSVPEPERFHAAIERASLTSPEVEMLKRLGPLAGRSPRGVKRLLNLYRLIRATRTGERLQGFLHGDTGTGGWPDYPGVQLCLAVQAGQPADQIHRFRVAVLAAAQEDAMTLNQLLDPPDTVADAEPPWRLAMRDFYAGLSVEQSEDEVRELIRGIVAAFGDDPRRCRKLREILMETSRFSFAPLSDHALLSGSSS